MTDVVLALRDVSKTFGGQRALVDVDVEIRRGEVHAIVGENGSGKSTLIKVLSGYHEPDPGASIEVDGIALRLGSPEASRHAGLRFVHQDLGLIDRFTVLENFGLTSGFPGSWNGIDWRAMRRSAARLLALVGLDLDLDRLAGELSAVERTGLAIARCLDDSGPHRARVLVLDEPTAALPTEDVDRLFEIVRDVAARGVTVIYVSHRLDEVMQLSDRITVLRDGKQMATADTSALDRAALVTLIVGSELAADDPLTRHADADAPAVVVSGLSTTTVADLDLVVGRGEVLGIAGLDGSGRETFARGLVGEASGTARRIELDGTALPDRLSPRAAVAAGMALVLANRDEGAAVRGMSISENITLPGLRAITTRGFVSRRRESQRTALWIDALVIRPAEPERDYATLSGGNRQKVVFAKWLNITPKLLVLDDPTSGVDVGARRAMYTQIRDAAATGLPVIVASSDLEDLARLCDRVLIMVGGRVTAEISGDEITEHRMTIEMSAATDDDRRVA